MSDSWIAHSVPSVGNGTSPQTGLDITTANRPSPGSHKGSLDESFRWSVFQPRDVEELFSESVEEVPWVVKGIAARGALSLLGGGPKVGKTTLSYELIERVALGEPFLGLEVTQAKTLLLGLEEHKRDIIARLRARSEEGLKGNVKVVFGPLPFSSEIQEVMADYIKREQIGLVVVDTIPAWWGLSDENDASEVLRKGFPLLNTIRRSNAAWLGLAHTRKSGGTHGADIRGSNALVGLVDVSISMKRTESGGNQRLLEAVSRYADTPEKVVIEYHDKSYRALGTPEAVSSEGKAKQVWEALTSEGQTMDELAEITGLSKQDVSRGITSFKEKVCKTGEGHRGNPFKYSRIDSSEVKL